MILADAGPDIFQRLLQFVQQLVMPDWNDLIAHGWIPTLLILIVGAFLLFMAWQYQSASSRNKPRLIPRYAGTPPPGVHVSAPSNWTPVVGVAAFFALLGLVLLTINRLAPLNVVFFVAGLVIGLVAIVGWLRDAMREWRHTAIVDEGAAQGTALAAVATAPLIPAASPSVASGMATIPAQRALVPVGEGGLQSASVPADEERQPPEGVHMPGPSPWPFFAPIALMIIFYGVIFSPVLVVAGLVLGIISAGGWLRDANREYRTTEEVGHPVPATRDPRAAWPRRLVPLFIGVVIISVVIMASGPFVSFIASFNKSGSAGQTPVAVPAKPEISASSAVSFETKTLIVPAGRQFELTFHNKNSGVPHNVRIETSDQASILFDGNPVTGVADATYQVPALQPGTYYFLCKIHPNMNGTVQAMPETGAGGSPGASPAGASPAAPTPGATSSP
jgi:plastocyanin